MIRSFFRVDDPEEAVLVYPSHVARVEPSISDRVGGRVLSLPVAEHDHGRASGDLTHLTDGDLVAVVDDLHVTVGQRFAYRTGA